MSVEFIDKVVDKRLDINLVISCYNISSILSDSNGKINKSTQRFILNTLQITAPGVPLIDTSNQVTTGSGWNNSLALEQFIVEVSSACFNLYNGISNNDDRFVVSLTQDSTNLNLSSPLLIKSTYLDTSTKTAVCVLFMELYSLYLELLSLTPDTTFKQINRNDLIRLDNNIRWLSNQLEAPIIPPYDLIKIIRDAQKTVLYLRSLPRLFVETYNIALSTFNGG